MIKKTLKEFFEEYKPVKTTLIMFSDHFNLQYKYNNLKDELKHTRANVRYEYNRGWRDGYRIAATKTRGGDEN